jgi:hypothetical protein
MTEMIETITIVEIIETANIHAVLMHLDEKRMG